MWTGIPVFKLTEAETERLVKMEEELHKRVIGQHEAIIAVSKAIRRARAGIKDPKRPTGSFIFLGPSGVGKTKLARTLAEFLFGDEDALIQVDMSEYMEKHSVSRLVGSPPGYVGYDEGGQLTEAVRRKPYSVLLLDEIEKAQPDVSNILLQILEEGRLTDAQGRKVDFRNTDRDHDLEHRRRHDLEERRPRLRHGRRVRPLVRGHEGADHGRAQEGLPPGAAQPHRRGHRLPQAHEEEILEIVELMMRRVREQISTHEVVIELSDAAKELLVEKGFDPTMGARPLRRAIQRFIEDPIADFVLGFDLQPGVTIVVDRKR